MVASATATTGQCWNLPAISTSPIWPLWRWRFSPILKKKPRGDERGEQLLSKQKYLPALLFSQEALVLYLADRKNGGRWRRQSWWLVSKSFDQPLHHDLNPSSKGSSHDAMCCKKKKKVILWKQHFKLSKTISSLYGSNDFSHSEKKQSRWVCISFPLLLRVRLANSFGLTVIASACC